VTSHHAGLPGGWVPPLARVLLGVRAEVIAVTRHSIPRWLTWVIAGVVIGLVGHQLVFWADHNI
jgi:hypothetical protein